MKADVQKPLFSIREAILLIVLVVFVLPIAVFLPFIVMKVVGADVSKFGLDGKSFFFFVLLSQCLGLIIAILIIWNRLRRNGLSWGEVGFRRTSVGRSIKYITGYYGLAVIFIIGLVILLTLIGVSPDTESSSSKAVFGPLWSNVLISVIIAPIIEEILFRGILLERFLHLMKPRYAIGLGAIIFAFAHLDPLKIIMLIPLAFYLSFMYYRLRSIYPGIVLHASWNLLVLLIQR
jgi:membrane protease YdiL (CAAX protease family)